MKKVVAGALATLALASSGVSRATVLEPGFVESTFATNAGSITSMAWAPDGSQRLFVLQKAGAVRIFKAGALLATPFSVDSVHTNSECGLLGIAFDPNFVENGFVYLFQTVSSNEQQIVRYTASGDVATNRTVILAGLPTRGVNHDGGAIGFGPDGKLYWAIGDLGNFTGVNDNLTSLASKVGRANRDGSLAPGNPFEDGAGPNNDYIWARGFRNPFTLAFQPGSGALWVDVAGTNYEQIFVVTAGSHAGYNSFENNQPAGYLSPVVAYRTNAVDTRTIANGGAARSGGVATYTTTSAHGFRKGARIDVAGMGDASFNGSFYVLATPSTTSFSVPLAGPNASSGGGTATTASIGGAVTGGDFWSSSALPAAYRGNYFFGDYNNGRLERVALAADGSVSSVGQFGSNMSGLVDVVPGPDGALYTGTQGGTIRRIAYNAAAQGLVLTPLRLRLDEGGRAVVSVRLALPPSSNVSVGAALSGDADVTVSGSTALTFTPSNWSTPQTLTVQAATDADRAEDLGTLVVSATGLAAESVSLAVTDLGSSGPATAVPAATSSHLAWLGLGLGAVVLAALGRRRQARAFGG